MRGRKKGVVLVGMFLIILGAFLLGADRLSVAAPMGTLKWGYTPIFRQTGSIRPTLVLLAERLILHFISSTMRW